MITRKVGPALAAGCTMVIKPSELTPYSALRFVRARREGADCLLASSPSFTGDPKPIGGEFTSNPLVRKLTFTGSTPVGKLLMSQCAGTVKKVSLELGGNAPFIVFDDADLEPAVNGAIASKYRNAGQTCVCANRIYVQSGIYDRFAARLAEKVVGDEGGQRLGSGHDHRTADRRQGRRQSRRARARCCEQRREGAGRRQACRRRRSLLCADGADRTSRPTCWRCARKRSARWRR